MLASKKTSRFHFKNKRLVNDLLKTLFFYVVVCLFYISGITLILMITSHDSIINLPIIKDKFYGLASIALIRQVPSLILGFSLLVCGRAIANRSAKAFYPTLIFLLLATLYTLVFYKSTAPTLLLALLAGLLFLSKDNLYRNQFIISHEDAFMDGFIWLFLIASYFILGYSNLVTSQKRSLVALEKHFAVPSLHWWLMGLLTLLAIIISLFLFLHLLKRKLYLIGSPFEEKRLEALLGKGDHHYTGLAFLQDKRLWYYQQDNQDKVALQFSQVRDKLLVMGDLFGEDAYFEKALNHFMTEADLYNFHPVFYEISEKQVMPVHDYGYDFIKLGEEGLVKPETFTLSGKKRQNLRSVMNQTQKAGYSFHVISPPYSDSLMVELAKISEQWLDGRKEMGYSLGFFDPYYLSKGQLALLISEAGQIVAFSSLKRSHSENSLSVDLMRYLKEAPKGIMDVLFIHIIEFAKEEGYDTFNIGMSPLSNVGRNRFSFFNEKLGNLIYQLGSQIYSFEGLRHYKAKFADKWTPYYIAYAKQSQFVFVILSLLLISYKKNEK